MDKKKLMNLIKKNEGRKLDFKLKLDLETETGKKELAKDVCAIANSKGGRGYIVVGVEDKTHSVIGIEEGKFPSEEMLQQIVSSRCEPPIPISLDIFNLYGKQLAVITIYNGDQRPYQVREHGAFYIRRGSTTDTMRKQELVSALQESLNLNVETCPILKSSVECLNMDIVHRYFKSKGIETNDENRDFLMESAGITIKDRETYKTVVTLGGLLVFSDINSVYIPHNMVRIVNNIRENIPKVYIVQGNLMTIIDESERIIKDILPEQFPSYAIVEGIKNAVLYRDYTSFYREIEVVIGYNSIVVSNPGNLIRGSFHNQKNFEYFKRNMWIYEKMITLDGGIRFLQNGRGFTIMKKAFRNKGKVKFINSYDSNSFKVIYPGVRNFTIS
ncbi:helix-turn-helix domain-containing protein [Clostridium thermarum]|uniref:AlbA family DNA-binding domain-containing protein n=1 Tax=Clostridium thermarum TaxID=1716543 RepID=UPI001120D1F8|nr:RNA-binding domain-containing protein [Clostridium thermarum]